MRWGGQEVIEVMPVIEINSVRPLPVCGHVHDQKPLPM